MSFLEEVFPIGAQQAAFCSCLQPDPSCASAAAAVGKAKNPQSCSPRNLLIRPKTREQFKDWLSGGFKYVLFSPRNMGKWSNLTMSYFSDVLKPPTSWFGAGFFLPSTLYNPLGLVHVRNLRGAIFEPQIQGWSVYPVIISNLNFQRKHHLFSLWYLRMLGCPVGS